MKHTSKIYPETKTNALKRLSYTMFYIPRLNYTSTHDSIFPFVSPPPILEED